MHVDDTVLLKLVLHGEAYQPVATLAAQHIPCHRHHLSISAHLRCRYRLQLITPSQFHDGRLLLQRCQHELPPLQCSLVALGVAVPPSAQT